MADNCCNPVTPEPCVHRCDKLVDACCVINEDGLPCIMPPVVINIGVVAGAQGITAATVSDVLPNPFYGVITVTSTTPNIFAPETTVTRIVGDIVYLSEPPIGSDEVDVVFTFTEQRQCDINEAVDEAICNLQQATVPCRTWIAVGPTGVSPADGTFLVGWDNIDFGPLVIQNAEYSNVFNCQVSLRGFVNGPWLSNPSSGIYTIFTLPIGFRPAATHVFSTTLTVENSTGGGACDGNAIAAFIIVTTAGDVIVEWNGRCCAATIVSLDDNDPTLMSVVLENISFEV